jgi:regulator of protease activity HflC (stomatin/prohibitin superfamily)
MIREVQYKALPGLAMLLALLAGLGLGAWWFVGQAQAGNGFGMVAGVVLMGLTSLLLGGLLVVNPNEARVLTLFGDYRGSVRRPGLWWANPFMVKKKVSLRVRNFETNKLKVNDSHSNPIEIAAVVVWKVVDSAEALFEVDDYEGYVHVQSESAVRTMASKHPYDLYGPEDIALSSHQAEVSKVLLEELQDRLHKAGVEVLEARISHLAYAPEIASAMLQRQQANAIIAARQKIVEGAVGMVENALEMLSTRRVLELDHERRATMVSNLLVVLCSERGTTPVVNAGSLYQ